MIYTLCMSASGKHRRVPVEVPRARAKVFMNGRSQAVRLPKEFRMPGVEVFVHRVGEAVVLEPVHSKSGWPDGYWNELERLTRGLGDFRVPEDPVPAPVRGSWPK
jgi:antitoxin VapB